MECGCCILVWRLDDRETPCGLEWYTTIPDFLSFMGISAVSRGPRMKLNSGRTITIIIAHTGHCRVRPRSND